MFACAGENGATPAAKTPVGETTVTSRNAADKTVVDKLATARCDQEQGCNNIGPGAKFASRDVCLNQIRGSIGNDLNAYNWGVPTAPPLCRRPVDVRRGGINCPSGLETDAIRCIDVRGQRRARANDASCLVSSSRPSFVRRVSCASISRATSPCI